MSLGLFNCRLIQLGGDRLFFFATGFAFFSVDLLEGRGGVKGARFWRGEANP